MLAVRKVGFAIAISLAAIGYCEFSTYIVSRVATNSSTFWLYDAQGITVNFVYLAVCTAIFGYLKVAVLPDSYFVPKPFERDGRIYQWTGVRIFEAILRWVGWNRLLRKNNSIRHNVAALQSYCDAMRGAESIHLSAAILTAVFTLSVAFRYSFDGTKWWWIFNLLLNIYPVMLQRYNRPRIERLIRRLEVRLGTKS